MLAKKLTVYVCYMPNTNFYKLFIGQRFDGQCPLKEIIHFTHFSSTFLE